jgi:hypothetical protein
MSPQGGIQPKIRPQKPPGAARERPVRHFTRKFGPNSSAPNFTRKFGSPQGGNSPEKLELLARSANYKKQ